MADIKHIHTIATAHLDTVWNWSFETTVRRYIPQTLNWNFHLFKKYPDYVFNFEGAYRYELMEEYYPEEFEKLKKYVSSGNWYPAGAAWENGDVNVPSPEALFRNFLLGNNYFDEKFSVRSRDVFLPDCFGFGYALPSIARHSNLYGFTTQKLTWGSSYGQPFDLGKWYGPDGNYIIASLKMHNYFAVLRNLRKSKAIDKKLSENGNYGIDSTEIFHGVGDRGGGPLPLSVAIMNRNMKKNDTSNIKVHSSPSDKLFKEIMTEYTEQQRDKLPAWNDELLLTNHGTGGYTSRAISKRWNKRGEELADMAERAAVAADWLKVEKYPQNQLNTSWKRIINHQFHDDLPGTSIQKAYLRSWNDYGLSLNQLSHEYEKSTAAVSRLLDTSFCKGTPLVVGNSLESERKECVTATVDGKYGNICVCDSNGIEVPSQVIGIKGDKTEIAFIAEVPPCSLSVFDLKESEKPFSDDGEMKVSESYIENCRYKVTLDDNGDIGSIYDKQLEKELLASPIVLGIFDYTGSWIYPAWELQYKQSIRKPDRKAEFLSAEVTEKGAARCTVRVRQKAGDSVFVNDISLYAGSDKVEVHSEFQWESLKTLCKNVFSFTCSDEKATFDLGLGVIKRGNAVPKMYEVPAQKWADITDENKEYGVSVLSDCKYGWDKFNNNTLRLTIVHTPLNNSRTTAMQSMMELGLNRYGYAICAHKGTDMARVQTAAREFSSPMAVFVADKHSGVLGRSFSFVRVSDSDVIVRAIKKAENSDEIVIRVNEGNNKAHSDVKIYLGNGIESAREIYASEEHIGDARVDDGNLVFDMKPYEVKSFAVKLVPYKENSCGYLRQFAVKLPYNTKATSSNKAPSGHGIYGKKYTVPEELLPENITSGNINFSIKKTGLDALLCDGQTLKLSKDYNKLVLLCASLSGDKEFTFIVGDKPVKIKISDIEERPVAWDLYSMKRTAKIKRDTLGWECTHTHSFKGDNAAHQLFFFKYEIDLDGAESVVLPRNKELIVLAATQCESEGEFKCASLLYDTVEPREFNYRLKNGKELVNYVYRKAIGLFWMVDNAGRIVYLHYRP